jgi:hypothetical protein
MGSPRQVRGAQQLLRNFDLGRRPRVHRLGFPAQCDIQPVDKHHKSERHELWHDDPA